MFWRLGGFAYFALLKSHRPVMFIVLQPENYSGFHIIKNHPEILGTQRSTMCAYIHVRPHVFQPRRLSRPTYIVLSCCVMTAQYVNEYGTRHSQQVPPVAGLELAHHDGSCALRRPE